MRRAEKRKSKISLTAAVFWIVSSVILIAGTSVGVKRHFAQKKQKELHDPKFRIVQIIQTSPQKEALSTLYLAELMQLSIDRPVTKQTFDLDLAEKRLLSSPVIESVRVSFDQPGAIVVDYVARRPVAWIYDFTNMGVDVLGVPFPIYPFYSPKKLPEIVLSEPLELHWNRPIDHPKMDLALQILEIIAPAPFEIRRVDVSGAFAESCGKRQIVLVIEENFTMTHKNREILCFLPRLLRLSTKNYHQELGNYLVLRDELSVSLDPEISILDEDRRVAYLPQQIIDLRIPGMGFLQDSGQK